MTTETMTRSSPPRYSARDQSLSPYSLSKENDDQTDELEGMTGEWNELQRMTNNELCEEEQEELTTSGRTYQELVEQNHSSRESIQSESMADDSDMQEDDASDSAFNRRKSVGVFLAGRNSMSNWSTFCNENPVKASLDQEVPVSVHAKEVRVSSLETPLLNKLDTSHVNTSQRRSHAASRQRSNQRSLAKNERASSYSNRGKHPSASSLPRRSTLSNNLSHISSSSSSIGEDALGESWSPIRSSLDDSFKNSVGNDDSFRDVGSLRKSPKVTHSKSPVKSASRTSRSKSPVRSLGRSPTRSPLADISPNRSRRGTFPKKSPIKSSVKETASALSPNGTFSLKEPAEDEISQMVRPTISDNTNPTKSPIANKIVGTTSEFSLPSLSRNASEVAPAEQTIFSPERPSNSGIHHVRSPAPTPNSQRRLIKRLRASLPTTNYLMPEDIIEDALESFVNNTSGVSRAETNLASSSSLRVMPSLKTSYRNEFEFPAIPGPRIATLALFHNEAINRGSSSHQYRLNGAGTDLLSLQEVILPAVAHDTNAILKKLQSKAQRNVKDGMPVYQGEEVVDVIETCRKVVAKCTVHAVEAAGKSWRDRQEQRHHRQVQRHAMEMQKQRNLYMEAKIQRKKNRTMARQQLRERQKYEKQKSHPRNKEMWQEVAKLMMDIQKLEKEERLWKEALSEVDSMEKNLQPPEKIDLDKLNESKSARILQMEQLCTCVTETQFETTSTTIIQDITVATERVRWMLQSVSLAMEESNRLRQEAFTKYQYDGHKFYGYQCGDSKGLFAALSMDDSFAG
ncbi:hypothetical protein HJC23_001344 [Cyclotella cryptica]|uniref:Uncharacterized protein n=1 Tax=Cyclotella cryptica TaxID=29204 RepID=A0ABD3PPF1_9STRA|eukprot:CCRYP_013123-RA/>CCRYP_013123-RA protein AED:0.00 eAED:0.00 QI:166/-1/1/1/-1/1/1/255/797